MYKKHLFRMLLVAFVLLVIIVWLFNRSQSHFRKFEPGRYLSGTKYTIPTNFYQVNNRLKCDLVLYHTQSESRSRLLTERENDPNRGCDLFFKVFKFQNNQFLILKYPNTGSGSSMNYSVWNITTDLPFSLFSFNKSDGICDDPEIINNQLVFTTGFQDCEFLGIGNTSDLKKYTIDLNSSRD